MENAGTGSPVEGTQYQSQAAFLTGAIQSTHLILDSPDLKMADEEIEESGATDTSTNCSRCCGSQGGDGENCVTDPPVCQATHPPICPGKSAAPRHASWFAKF